jgi:hypothetical protein
LAEGVETCLGRSVDEIGGSRPLARNRGEHHERPLTLLSQMPGTVEQHRARSDQVDLQHVHGRGDIVVSLPAPTKDAALTKSARFTKISALTKNAAFAGWAENPDGEDHYVRATKLLEGFADYRLMAVDIASVKLEGERLHATCGDEVLTRAREPLAIAAHQRDFARFASVQLADDRHGDLRRASQHQYSSARGATSFATHPLTLPDSRRLIIV